MARCIDFMKALPEKPITVIWSWSVVAVSNIIKSMPAATDAIC